MTWHVTRSAKITATPVPAGRQRRWVHPSAQVRSEAGFLPTAAVFTCTFSSSIETQSVLAVRDWTLAKHKLLGRRPQRLQIALAARFGVGSDNRFGPRQPVANPRAVVQNQLEAVGPDNLDDLAPAQLFRISLQLLSERGFLLRGQVEVLANREIGTNLGKKSLQLCVEADAARGNHLRHEQAGNHAVFLRDVAADGEARRFLAADGDFV